jgi:hypothetical protein
MGVRAPLTIAMSVACAIKSNLLYEEFDRAGQTLKSISGVRGWAIDGQHCCRAAHYLIRYTESLKNSTPDLGVLR